MYRYNKPDGSGLNDIVNFETYKYAIDGNTPNQSILTSPNIEALSAESELIIENRNFTANETIFAWDKITLKGNISSNAGVSIIIKTAGEIIIDPEAVIDPDITLLIGNPALCNPTRIQPTIITSSYCKDAAQYQGNKALSKNEDATPASTLVNNLNQSVLYPNPTITGNFIVETMLHSESFIHVTIFDLTGKLIHKQESEGSLSKGKHKLELNNLVLENGLFLVEVETNQGKKMYKLIKTQ